MKEKQQLTQIEKTEETLKQKNKKKKLHQGYININVNNAIQCI